VLRAVLTREDVEAYAAQLSPQGIEVVAMPVTQQLADANDRDVLARALQTGPFAAVVVASRHAAIFLAAARRTSSAANLGEIWAVGPATRQSLEGEGLTSHYPPGVHDGAELARALMASRDLRGQRVLVPHAEQGRSEAIELLREAGADVVDVVAYRTHAVAADHPSIAAGRELLTGYGVAVCAVFSPSQVAALTAIVGPLVEVPTQFCAIGETTAAALRAAGLTQIGVAATPTPDGLATAVRTLLATTP
jgi:uroporphyrinogen-III synthase